MDLIAKLFEVLFPVFGVIGIGYWGKKHVEEYHELGHDVTICDNDEENITKITNSVKLTNSLQYF